MGAWTENLPARLASHTERRGARLAEVVIGQGIGFVLARTWSGDRFLERALKRRRMAPRYCPICCAQRRRRGGWAGRRWGGVPVRPFPRCQC